MTQASGKDTSSVSARGSSLMHPLSAGPGSHSLPALQTAPSNSSIIITLASATASADRVGHPGHSQQQAPTGGTVSSMEFSHQGVQPLPAGSSCLLPLGTIIMPANDKMPPGSFVLPQGNLPGGQLRLALPSQLPLQLRPHLPLSQPPTQLHASARPGQYDCVPSLTEPASSCRPSGNSQHNGPEMYSTADVGDQSSGADAAACQPIGGSAIGHEVQGSKQGICRSAPEHEIALDSKQGTQSGCSALRAGSRVGGPGVNHPVRANDEQEADDESIAASEGTSMLGELTALTDSLQIQAR